MPSAMTHPKLQLTLLVGSALSLLMGIFWQLPMLIGGGAIALVSSAVTRIKPRLRRGRMRGDGESRLEPDAPLPDSSPDERARKRIRFASTDGTPSAAIIDAMIQQGRYALLLRPELIGNLNHEQLQMVREIIEEEMALIRGGEVDVFVDLFDSAKHQASRHDSTVRTESMYLDRFAITNGDYQQFVNDGGYQDEEFWDDSIADALNQFVDRTDNAGPRYWSEGHFPEGQGDHPVVGVNFHEARAYARWAGKRLPRDAEWVRAAAAPIHVTSGNLQQRKYPWGDGIDESRANLWLSGMQHTTPVFSYPAGDSVQGVRQLVGNVWEWNADPFGCWSESDMKRFGELGFRALRGGAFDTYFEGQACCRYQSGDHPLARKHNIGFRCAISAADVTAALGNTEETQ